MIGSISLKQALKVGGTLLFLFGVFGYIYPRWDGTIFTNNENLFHVVTGLLALFTVQFSPIKQRLAILLFALMYWGIGVYGFFLASPTAVRIGEVTAQLDAFDNYAHIIIGLAWAWFWLRTRTR